MPDKLSPRIEAYDERWEVIVPGEAKATEHFCAEHFIKTANEAICQQGYFAVALSGGSTPKAVFKELSQESNRQRLDWKKVLLFWSDERSVPADHPDSNYHMAME